MKYLFICLLWITLQARCSTYSAEPDVVQLKKQTWWDANTQCTKLHKRLFVPTNGQTPTGLFAKMNETRDYWVGGLEMFTPWKWTADNTLLYAHIGYLNTTTSMVSRSYNLQDNDPASCDQKCALNTPFIGLQATRCICLPDVDTDRLVPASGSNMYKCPGSFKETCGSQQYFSIYESGLFPLKKEVLWRPKNEGLCGFVQYDTDVVKLSTNDCSSDLSLLCTRSEHVQNPVCVGDLCLKYDSKNWTESSGICSLASVTPSNVKDLLQLNLKKKFSYWVGLRRSRQWLWLDDLSIKGNMISADESRECLAVKTDWSSGRYSLESCSKRLPAICVKYSDAKKNSQAQQGNASMGIGVAAGITVVVLCVILLVWVKRTKCKKRSVSKNDDDTPAGHFYHFGNRLDKDVELAASTTLYHVTPDVSKSLEENDHLDSDQSATVNDYFVVEKVTADSTSGSGSAEHLYDIANDNDLENEQVQIQQNSGNDFSDLNSVRIVNTTQNTGKSKQITEIYEDVHKPKWRPLADDSVSSYSHLKPSDFEGVDFYDKADNGVSSKPVHCETYSCLRGNDDG